MAIDFTLSPELEQMRQQPDVLPERKRARRLGLGPRSEVEMSLFPVFGQAELHTDRVVAGEGALVHPLQPQPNAGNACQRRCS